MKVRTVPTVPMVEEGQVNTPTMNIRGTETINHTMGVITEGLMKDGKVTEGTIIVITGQVRTALIGMGGQGITESLPHIETTVCRAALIKSITTVTPIQNVRDAVTTIMTETLDLERNKDWMNQDMMFLRDTDTQLSGKSSQIKTDCVRRLSC